MPINTHDVVVINAKSVRDILIPTLAKELAWVEEQKEYRDFNISSDWYTIRAQLLKDLRLMTGLDRPDPLDPASGPENPIPAPRDACDGCGTRLPITQLKEVGDYRYCDFCFKTKSFQGGTKPRPFEEDSHCDECGTKLPAACLRTVGDVELCQTCYETKSFEGGIKPRVWAKCSTCCQHHRKDQMKEKIGNYLCRDCEDLARSILGGELAKLSTVKRWVTYHKQQGNCDWIQRWDHEPKENQLFEVSRTAIEVPI